MNLDAGTPRLVVSIRPTIYDAHALTLQQCVTVVDTSQVRTRGWYFPHINREGTGVGEGGRYVFNETGYNGKDEVWRMYRSSQFLFRGKLWEVGDEHYQEKLRDNFRYFSSSEARERIVGYISFIGLIYSVAEIYAFAANLSQAVPLDSSVAVDISLHDTNGWALASGDPSVHLDYAYVSTSNLQRSDHILPIDELVANPLGHAVTATLELFEQLTWFRAGADMIAGWQREIFRR